MKASKERETTSALKKLERAATVFLPEPENVADMNKNEKWSIPITLWGALRDVLSSSTVHGIAPMFATRNHIVRAVWFVLTLGGLGCAVYFTYLSTKGYFSYEVSVSIESVDESPIDFP